LRAEPEFMKQAVCVKGERAMAYASKSLCADMTFAHQVLGTSPHALQHMEKAIRGHKDTVRLAANRDTTALQFADEMLLGDKDFMFEMLQQEPTSVRFFDVTLKSDPDLFRQVYMVDLDLLQYASLTLRSDKMFMLEAIRLGGWKAYSHCAAALKADPAVKRAASDSALNFASDAMLFRAGSRRGIRDNEKQEALSFSSSVLREEAPKTDTSSSLLSLEERLAKLQLSMDAVRLSVNGALTCHAPQPIISAQPMQSVA